MNIVAATGHRPDKLGGYSHENLIKLVKFAKKHLDGVDKVISGMALGWDTAMAMAAMEQNIPFIAAIPFLGQERMWPSESKIRYQYLLKHAEDVVYVCDPGYAPWKMQVRNKWMVDHSDLVLALWNGTEGGTANCIEYAQSQNKPINNLWSQFEAPSNP